MLWVLLGAGLELESWKLEAEVSLWNYFQFINTHLTSTFLRPQQKVRNNGSVYLHTYVVPLGFSPDPKVKDLYSRAKTVHSSKMLNKFKRKRYAKTHNLLTGETSASLEEQEVSFYNNCAKCQACQWCCQCRSRNCIPHFRSIPRALFLRVC
jgi:hypothetical protein